MHQREVGKRSLVGAGGEDAPGWALAELEGKAQHGTFGELPFLVLAGGLQKAGRVSAIGKARLSTSTSTRSMW